MDAAAKAMAAGDAGLAQAQWRIARATPNAPAEAWFLAAERGGDSEADPLALLGDAIARFPDSIRLMHDLARAYERRRDWPKAEKYWRRHIAAGGRQWWAYAALAAALRAQYRDDEGDVVLHEGILLLPGEPNLLAEAARAAENRHDLKEATRVWDVLIGRFPDRWIGYRGKAHVLTVSGRPADADRLIEACALSMPDDIDALHDLARLSERQRDWPRVETLWRAFLAIEQRAAWAYVALARSLREQSRADEAAALLRDAKQRFPADTEIAREAARCAGLLGDHGQAAQHWQTLGTLRPKSPEGPLGEAALLRQTGQAAAADEVIVAAIKRLPDEPSLLEAYGLNAMASSAWIEALTRFEAGQRRFPSNDALRQRILEARLKITDSGGVPPPMTAEDDSAAEERALVMQFESLGGGGHGCEFGIFQRQFGAEPLGLLRWADIFQEQLSTALETEFAGIGDPEFTNIFVPDNSSNPEYWTTDTRYHMAMRSFVSVADVPIERMRQQVTKRLGFLSRKLADDLRHGGKIFVYKNMKRNLTDAELGRLHRACRAYGDNTLLYIRYEDASHPNGSVLVEDDGLLVGYIDHFSHTPDTDQYIGPATDGFLRLCRGALKLWKPAQAAA